MKSIEQPSVYKDAVLPIETRVNHLLSQMTLAEKVGQMAQVEKNSITPQEVIENKIGSVLSGGGGSPAENNPQTWLEMVTSFLEAAAGSRLGIPAIYGVDAVHGHGNVYGATIFPHNIGLGATCDTDLVRRIARITAVEVAATGIRWNFAPAISVARDIRWGRTFESYSEDPTIVAELGAAYIRGLRGADLTDPTSVLASVKHFIADGGTSWGSSVKKYEWIPGYWEQVDGRFMLDQGVADIDEATLRQLHLPPYLAAIEAGARNIMVSYSSWGGLKMHAQKYLLTDLVKGELGFVGFLVSDWYAINQIDPDYYTCVVKTINAGLDMVMVPFDYKLFISELTKAVNRGDVSMSRIDDAVRRILRVKMELGLFENPLPNDSLLPFVGCEDHRQVGREAVRKSAVLLKNDQKLIPIPKDLPSILVTGQAANDIGLCCGGWTINWMGGFGDITPGSTILQGIQETVSAETMVQYAADGSIPADMEKFALGVVVISETLYVEGYGDQPDLNLTETDISLLDRTRAYCEKVVVILVSGRPLLITTHLPKAEAWIAAWLPGTEANGLADVLFGDFSFTGKLPFTWPKALNDLPAAGKVGEAVLFPVGHGLT